jgi:hypothetical protein
MQSPCSTAAALRDRRRSVRAAGYLAVGRSSKFQLARAYCAEAFTLGDFAQEPNLRAWARGLQSFCEYYAQDYGAALRFAEDGLVHAPIPGRKACA